MMSRLSHELIQVDSSFDEVQFRWTHRDSGLKVFNDLDEVVRLDLRHHYTGPICARRWLDPCQDKEHGHLDLVDKLTVCLPEVTAHLRESIQGRLVAHLVSLGPGDGEIDLRILEGLASAFRIGSYWGLDSSFDLLSSSSSRILRSKLFQQQFQINAVCGDFISAWRQVDCRPTDDGTRLLALTGFTLGNHVERQLLEGIVERMSPKDFLFLDARVHSLESQVPEGLESDVKEQLLCNYANELVNRFAFGPVEVATEANARDVHFEYELNRDLTCVPNAYNVVISFLELETRMRFGGQPIQVDRMPLAATTLYYVRSLAHWLPSIGLRPVWRKSVGNIAFFLLRRTKL